MSATPHFPAEPAAKRDPVTVLEVHAACEEFASRVAAAIVTEQPSACQDAVKAVCSVDAWILATDMSEWAEAEVAQNA